MGDIMATGTGNTTITFSNDARAEESYDKFGVLGSHTTSATITGLTEFTNTDHAEAWIMGSDSTATHTQLEHQMAPIKFKITNPISGVGFTINATSDYRLTGDFKVRYVYAS